VVRIRLLIILLTNVKEKQAQKELQPIDSSEFVEADTLWRKSASC
jgi:hypothetical protein